MHWHKFNQHNTPFVLFGDCNIDLAKQNNDLRIALKKAVFALAFLKAILKFWKQLFINFVINSFFQSYSQVLYRQSIIEE